jgi:L-ascorbate metabolism protein UlaG (beta-lactamase superfamily)
MSLKITWHGQSAFSFEADGKTVMTDPFLSGNPVSTTSPASVNPSTILLSHAHNDHVGDTVDIATRTGATVIATFELANYIKRQGVKNVIGGNHGGTVAFDGGTTKFTPAWHTSSYSDGSGNVVAPGIPAGHVIRFGGKTIYFAGDTALFLDMQLIGEEGIDVAILPIGDLFTMGPKDALKAVRMLNPATVIPCHYNTFDAIKQDANAFKADVEGQTAATVVVLAPGESTELS